MTNNNEKILVEKINKFLEEKFEVYFDEEIYPSFLKVAKKSFKKNLYDLYQPVFYERKNQLLKSDIWEVYKEKGIYHLKITENLKGEFYNTGRKEYLPKLIVEGKINRRGNQNKKPRPIITNLKKDLRDDKEFKELLKRYNIERR